MPDHDRLQVVRDCYDAYVTGDRAAVERILTDDFTFSAPPDVSIDRAFELKRLFEAGGEVFVTYEATRVDGRRFRNTEIFGFDGDRIGRVEVYFGWDVE